MLRKIHTLALAAAVFAALGPASSAFALTISGLTIDTSATTTPGSGAAADRAVAFTGEVLSSSTTSFSTRFRTRGVADVGAFGSAASQSTSMNYTISFAVTHANGVNYQLDIATSLLGALTLVSDGGGASTASIGPIVGAHTGGTGQTGSLGLSGTSSVTSAVGANTPVSRSGTATIFGTGTGASQSFTLTFTGTFSASSPGGIAGGDEGAYRFGNDGATASILGVATADDYPGVGSRNGLLDGHFVTLTAVPEPGTAFLLASGLTGLSIAGRRRRA